MYVVARLLPYPSFGLCRHQGLQRGNWCFSAWCSKRFIAVYIRVNSCLEIAWLFGMESWPVPVLTASGTGGLFIAISITKPVRAKFERFAVERDTGGLWYQLITAASLRKVLWKLARGQISKKQMMVIVEACSKDNLAVNGETKLIQAHEKWTHSREAKVLK